MSAIQRGQERHRLSFSRSGKVLFDTHAVHEFDRRQPWAKGPGIFSIGFLENRRPVHVRLLSSARPLERYLSERAGGRTSEPASELTQSLSEQSSDKASKQATQKKRKSESHCLSVLLTRSFAVSRNTSSVAAAATKGTTSPSRRVVVPVAMAWHSSGE